MSKIYITKEENTVYALHDSPSFWSESLQEIPDKLVNKYFKLKFAMEAVQQELKSYYDNQE